jgi:hypothetical protein
MRWFGTTLRLAGSLLILNAERAAAAPAPASRPATRETARQLCVAQGGTFTTPDDGAGYTCVAPERATFTRRQLADARAMCEAALAGQWEDVFGIWYVCELPG